MGGYPSGLSQEAVCSAFCGGSDTESRASSCSSSSSWKIVSIWKSRKPGQQLSLNLFWWFQENSEVVSHPGKIILYQMFQISWWKHRRENKIFFA